MLINEKFEGFGDFIDVDKIFWIKIKFFFFGGGGVVGGIVLLCLFVFLFVLFGFFIVGFFVGMFIKGVIKYKVLSFF